LSERRERAGEARRRLEAAGWRREERAYGKVFWKEPASGRRLSEDHAMNLIGEMQTRRLEEAGWEPVEVEGETYWRRPDSGRLYPRGAAYDLLERD
jgi:hypothetical protein